MNSRHRSASRKTFGLAVLAGFLVVAAAVKTFLPPSQIAALRARLTAVLGLSHSGRTPAYESSYSGLPVPFDVSATDKDNPFLSADDHEEDLWDEAGGSTKKSEPAVRKSHASQSEARGSREKSQAKPTPVMRPEVKLAKMAAQDKREPVAQADETVRAQAKEISVWEAMSDTSGLHVAVKPASTSGAAAASKKDRATGESEKVAGLERPLKVKSRAPASVDEEEHDLFIGEMGLTEAQYEVYKREKAKLKEKLQVADQLKSSGYEKAQTYRSVLLKNHRNWVKKFIGAENFRLYQDFQDQQEL